MSNQNPWGNPPPQGPSNYGPPPPNSPPPGAPGGYGGYSGGPSYGGPPSGGGRGGRRGLTILLSVVGVLVIAGIAVGAFFIARGGGNDDNTATDNPTSTAPTTSAPTTSAPTSTTPTTPTTAPTTDADTVSGTGYQFELPSNSWHVLKQSEVKSLGARIDSGIALGTSIHAASANILVERGSAPGVTLEGLQPTWKKNIETSVGAKAHEITATTVDGEPADAVRVKSVQGGDVQVQQVAYLLVHDGYYYSVAVSYQASDDRGPELDFGKLLQSWAWTS